MRIRISSEFRDPKKAKRILEPESASDTRKRSIVRISARGRSLFVDIKADDVNAARAATNTYLKLIGLIKEIGDF